jgi:hypothetical protein
MTAYGLSKSRITAFEQCAKRLWLQVHRRKMAQIDQGAEARFAAGREAGAAARALHPKGVMIKAEPDFAAALDRTADLIRRADNPALFEATFAHDGVLVRVDVMEATGNTMWQVAEVKSSTSRKDYHLGDLATQIWVMREAGVPIASAAIRLINNQFVLEEAGNYCGLFADAPSLEEIEPLVATRGHVVSAAREALTGSEPQREIGEHCDSPFTCEFKAYCSQGITGPEWPISLLPNTGRRVAAIWADQGVHELTAVPNGALANALHDRIHRATCTGEVYLDIEGARLATKDWGYPRTWLDFETIAFVVPRWVGTKPWEQVPFQFSAHIERSDGAVEHREFLSLDGEDPRRACAEALLAKIPTEGAVIAYNASFERSCIKRLAEFYPDLSHGLRHMEARVVDLLPVTKNHWYHRDQRGSWSIKAVLPTITSELSYETLAVKDGMAAQLAYMEAIRPETSAERRAEIDQALRAYCERDTEAMIVLMRRLTWNA